jgi:hypothetical protein
MRKKNGKQIEIKFKLDSIAVESGKRVDEKSNKWNSCTTGLEAHNNLSDAVATTKAMGKRRTGLIYVSDYQL